MAVNKYWICVKRCDSAGNSTDLDSVHTLRIGGNTTSHDIRKQLYSILGIRDEEVVLKLRNSEGSLVPINKNLRPNTEREPYILETTDYFQNVSPSAKSVPLDIYYETVKRRLEKIVAKIENVEKVVPADAPCQNAEMSAKAEEEMKILERKLNFLETRFREADDTQWKGMFKKHPMW